MIEPFDLPRRAKAQPGPAFAAKAMPGDPWGRSSLPLDFLVNHDDITRLVVFDTWTLNCDRHYHDVTVRKPNYDNVYLLKVSIHAMQSRIERSSEDLQTEDALAAFAASRANDLRLTEPRLAVLDDFDNDFERLYAKLVEVQSTEQLAEASPAEVLPLKLCEVFYRLQQSRKIWQPGRITVPVYNRKLNIPYAYKNGVVNLVKPHVFPATKRAETQAASLAINGDLL